MNNSEHLRNLNKRVKSNKDSSKRNKQWRVWTGILFVILMTVMNWQWAWGILFLIWVIPDLKNGITYFIEPVERSINPLLYWVIVITWILLSLLSLSTLFIDYNNLGY
ncbi:hypothetical protein [Psychroserpens sp. MEBiC05023]